MRRTLSWDALLFPDAPWAHLIVCDESEIDDFVATLPLGSAVVARILRGVRCAGKAGLLQEWAAALQFPYYFGGNWDAFEECLTDLSWLPGVAYVFFVTRTDRVLDRSAESLRIFLDILTSAAVAWAGEQRPISFRVVFHCDPSKDADVCRRLARAGLRL